MERYNVKELSEYLNDNSFVCHVNSIEEHAKLKEYFFEMADYIKNYNFYLLSAYGVSQTPYYKTIEFNQIDFEENLLNNIQIW